MTEPTRPAADESENTVARSLSPLRKRWLAVAVSAFAVALAYGVGRFQGALAQKSAEERDAKALQAGVARLKTCETAGQLLSARRDLSQVAVSLDRRNFGVAETQRRSALVTLERPSVSGMARVAEVATAVRSLDLAVDPDPGTKRAQVIAATEALDGVLTSLGR